MASASFKLQQQHPNKQHSKLQQQLWHLPSSSSNNNITGGSVALSSTSDYYLYSAGATNNFTNTNFTASRKIYFAILQASSTIQPDYSNIWLKTNVSASATITRNLARWSQTNMSWNENVTSGTATANYNLTGLMASTKYTIYSIFGNTQVLNYTQSTDASGVLVFNMSLNTTTRMIMVNSTAYIPPPDTIPPTFSNYNANTTIAGAPVTFSTVITDNAALSGYIFGTNNTGRWVNYTWTSLSSGGTAYNITRLNSTIGAVVNISFYANDTSNNWAVYRASLTTTDGIPPYFSASATNTTVAGKPANFTISVTDNANLGSTAKYIFSTNNSGTWRNSSYRSFAGSGLTLTAWNVTTLNSTVGALVQWRFYANDTSNNWNVSAIYSLITISGVTITPLCDPEDDFTGTCQYLALYGDLSYLDIKWSARYSNDMEKEIRVDCYLNCPNPGTDMDTKCADYKNSTNYCSYKALTGYGFCTIVKPGYLFKGQINNVTCNFYDPANPTVNYLPYPNRTFEPIDFDVYSALNVSVTVGESFALPVNVRNFGLFAGNFTSNTSALVKPYLVSIENPIGLIEKLKYNDIGEMYSKVTFLSAEKINLKVLVKSNLDLTTCSVPADCSYLGSDAECIGSKCWKRTTVEIKSGMLSLPEFNWTGVIQIMIIASIALILFKKRF